jgi:hypothetical protein
MAMQASVKAPVRLAASSGAVLASARELCARVLREAKAGRDPAAEKRRRRELQHAAESDTLRAVSAEFLRRHPTSPLTKYEELTRANVHLGTSGVQP